MSYYLWIRKIGEQHRLRLPEEIWTKIPWLKGEEMECTGTIGVNGELQISPHIAHRDVVSKLAEALKHQPPRSDEASTSWVDFARYNATQWPLKFQPEQGRKRMALVFPKDARDLGVAPAEGMTAAIFSAGEILEVWKADAWVSHCRESGMKLSQLAAQAMEALAERE